MAHLRADLLAAVAVATTRRQPLVVSVELDRALTARQVRTALGAIAAIREVVDIWPERPTTGAR